ncbi:hypothetical protein EYC80_000077 [Monilinia laxa]|uniref:Uncharacterized protein n=1 Tax=Monilinia laxa TaxID=61186 RepID=A0A5N6K9G2_MONLA|nr:hypothetical protein EYC80_000077 [Monilinia laxa]
MGACIIGRVRVGKLFLIFTGDLPLRTDPFGNCTVSLTYTYPRHANLASIQETKYLGLSFINISISPPFFPSNS